MLFILPVFFLVAFWLILDFVRRRSFERDYIELKKRAIEKGVSEPLPDAFFRQYYNGGRSMRVGIVAIVLGVTLLLFLPARMLHYMGIPHVWGLGAGGFLFIIGLIVCAFGLANILVYLFVDRPRRER